MPVWDDRKLFEFLILESAQAGLSWITILRKRENYRKAFARFDPKKVAKFKEKDVRRLLQDAGLIRNRAKIEASIKNANAFLKVVEEFGSFSSYIWKFVDGKAQHNRIASTQSLPAKTDLSEAISKDLKKRGFSFLGPTVVYAHMQATGMVNDHVLSCFRHSQVKKLSR